MQYYPDSATLNRILEELFQRTLTNPAARKELERSRMHLLVQISDPDAVVSVNTRVRPAIFRLSQPFSRPDLAIHTSMDVLHRVLLRELRLREAYFTGSMQVDGSLFRARKLEDLFHHLQEVYPRVLQDHPVQPGADGEKT